MPQRLRYILNHMVQYMRTRLDTSFAALSDATRRGVLEQVGRADASITDLAETFHMTLTGMKKHVGVLEQAGLVTTKKIGRVRNCQLGPRRLEEETVWLERDPQRWDERFDALDKGVEALTRKEKSDERKKRKEARPRKEPHHGGTEVGPRGGCHADHQRPGAHRVRGIYQGRAAQALVGAQVDGNDPAVLRGGCSCRRQVPIGIRPRWPRACRVFRHVCRSEAVFAPRVDQ